jgi:exo-beta-1,3-glucanase (GH17 family)/cellulose synthase/poly-beta-1,6-N-acetylglucosamine synthase-like glycosyltransferase
MRSAVAALVLACLLHGALWSQQGQSLDPPDLAGRVASLSFAPFDPAQEPDDGARASEARIRADMAVVAPYAKAIRTYAATGGLELVPGIAQEFGLQVTLGAWIDTDETRNQAEIEAALELAARHHNVQALIVGNETVLRQEKSAAEVAELIRQVKQHTDVPVSTGEVWHVWLDHPELVAAVDFIAAHVLPYWEGLPAEDAVDHVQAIYEQLRAAYPGKHVVIAEFGWPSAGYNRKDAEPDPLLQAEVVRSFADRARDLGIDYNLVEAFDQPWKTFEGSVGAYWGLFDAGRNLKFDLEGLVQPRGQEQLGGAALVLGALIGLGVLALRRPTFGQALLVALAAQALGAWLAIAIAHPLSHYLVVGSAVMWGLGLLLLVPLALLSYARIGEIAAVALGGRPQRLLLEAPVAGEDYRPKVSIHIPAYREPPEMLRQTLLSVAALDYPDFECVVAINNTPDQAFWQPIEQLCRALGPRFKFLHLQHLAGFKAGALRHAMAATAPEAEIIAVLDADYCVEPDWLKDLVPCFADPAVGIVQAPQDHRDGARSAFHAVLNAEYAGFFDIGMVQRNEADAIVVHGTMCLIRRRALEEAGGWSSDTITEDSDLGLAILEQGWKAHYTRRRYGRGLLPDSFAAFQRQRQRWAYGGLQILKKHWRRFLPGRSRLTWSQRREYLAGWLHWMGAESLGVAAALFNLAWVPVVLLGGVAIPESVLMLPVLIVFVVNLLHFALLYRLRVALPFRQALGAALAAMSLQFTMARAVAEGLIRDNLPFRRTEKGGAAKRAGGFPACWEAAIGFFLVLGAILLLATNESEVREIDIFGAVLLVQALPFLATVVMALLERGLRWVWLPVRLRRAQRAAEPGEEPAPEIRRAA